MDEIAVRAEHQQDHQAIDVVHLSAFEGDDEVALVEALRRSPGYIPELALVAEFKGRIVGHIMLTKVRLHQGAQEIEILGLGPMAVVPSQSHRGIGSELIRVAVEKARGLGYKAVVVAGHPEYYQRSGFSPATDWGLHCTLPVSEDVITAMELEAGALQGGGKVIYPSQYAGIYRD